MTAEWQLYRAEPRACSVDICAIKNIFLASDICSGYLWRFD